MVDVARREDRMLDELGGLYARRDDTLHWLDLLIESDPPRATLYWFLIDRLEGTDA